MSDIEKLNRFYLIAGEHSGDFIGSKLITSIRDIWPNKLEFYGIGGDLMQSALQNQFTSIKQINIIGFTEIIKHIPRLYRLIDQVVNDIIKKKIDILITIDSPSFTFRIAKLIKNKSPNIKLIHVVAPSVWAYKMDRARQYAKIYDHLLTLLPFEPQYFTKYGLDTHFIGHPIFEQDFYRDSKILRESMNIHDDVKIIAITPGSRISEIRRHMPIIRDTLEIIAKKYKILAIFIQNNKEYYNVISHFLSDSNFDYLFSTEKLKSFAASDCALAKSGTNSLEILASLTPMVVYYKVNIFSFLLIKLMIKIKFINLVNILAEKSIIPEFIQYNCTAKNLANAIAKFLEPNNKNSSIQIRRSLKILKRIGLNADFKPSAVAARIIANIADK